MASTMLLPPSALRRLPPRIAWLLVAVDIIQYSGIALIAVPVAIGAYLVSGALFALGLQR